MGKSVFILDRPDFQRYCEVLPKDEQRTKLEKVLKKARDEYQAHLHREGTLAAEIASVSREIGRKPDPELTNRLGCLIAQREVWPEITRECAEVFARALAAWGQATWGAFDQVHREAEAALDEDAPEFVRLTKRQNSIRRNDDPEHDEIRAKLAEIFERARPLKATRQTAHQGRAAVEAFVTMTLGTQVQRAQVSERDITAFVELHTSRKVAA